MAGGGQTASEIAAVRCFRFAPCANGWPAFARAGKWRTQAAQARPRRGAARGDAGGVGWRRWMVALIGHPRRCLRMAGTTIAAKPGLARSSGLARSPASRWLRLTLAPPCGSWPTGADRPARTGAPISARAAGRIDPTSISIRRAAANSPATVSPARTSGAVTGGGTSAASRWMMRPVWPVPKLWAVRQEHHDRLSAACAALVLCPRGRTGDDRQRQRRSLRPLCQGTELACHPPQPYPALHPETNGKAEGLTLTLPARMGLRVLHTRRCAGPSGACVAGSWLRPFPLPRSVMPKGRMTPAVERRSRP